MENQKFELKKIIYNEENSIILLGKDDTCQKHVDRAKYYTRLENEAKCLEILNGVIAPKLISYDKDNHIIRMEYINGLTLNEYVNKYNEIPKYFFAKFVTNLLNLLEHGIEYGGDIKYSEHFIIEEEKKEIRFIDFGISNILKDRPDLCDFWRKNYIRNYAFIFCNSNEEEQERSRNEITNCLIASGINKHYIDTYFQNYEKLELE